MIYYIILYYIDCIADLRRRHGAKELTGSGRDGSRKPTRSDSRGLSVETLSETNLGETIRSKIRPKFVSIKIQI